MNVIEEAEDCIYDWIISLPEDEIRDIHDGEAILNSLNEEAEEEIKDQLWESIKSSLNFKTILNKIKIFLKYEMITPVDSSDSDSSY
jgi:hypothetical protein